MHRELRRKNDLKILYLIADISSKHPASFFLGHPVVLGLSLEFDNFQLGSGWVVPVAESCHFVVQLARFQAEVKFPSLTECGKNILKHY